MFPKKYHKFVLYLIFKLKQTQVAIFPKLKWQRNPNLKP